MLPYFLMQGLPLEMVGVMSVTLEEEAGKAKELMAKAKAHCLISNSVKTKVAVEPTIS
jgi:organic hydroperoxide reductase OsmC/OhrA